VGSILRPRGFSLERKRRGGPMGSLSRSLLFYLPVPSYVCSTPVKKGKWRCLLVAALGSDRSPPFCFSGVLPWVDLQGGEGDVKGASLLRVPFPGLNLPFIRPTSLKADRPQTRLHWQSGLRGCSLSVPPWGRKREFTFSSAVCLVSLKSGAFPRGDARCDLP